jgi:hypothetical protein
MKAQEPSTSASVPQKKKKAKKRYFAISYPPPVSVAHQIELADFVKMKEETFQAKGSDAWIQLFGTHPSIVKIESDRPTSEVYAERYLPFFDQERDETKRTSTGLKLTYALKSYLEHYPDRFPWEYKEDVMLQLRDMRLKQRTHENGKRWREMMRQKREEEKPAYMQKRRSNYQRARTSEEKSAEAARFLMYLKTSGLDYENLRPKQLEEQTRDFDDLYYAGQTLTAGTDMLQYMLQHNMDRAEAMKAKMTRSAVKRASKQKRHKTKHNLKVRQDSLARGGHADAAPPFPPSPSPASVSHLQSYFDSTSLGPDTTQERCDAMYYELYDVLQGEGAASAPSYQQEHDHQLPGY